MWLQDALFISIYAILYSALEIEIEGPYGWAKKLPTVKMFNTRFTGYHILMNITVIMSIAYAIIPRKGLLYGIFFIIAWFLIEDFCWFVLNPYYGINKYYKENISWHEGPWPLGIPIHNYIGISLMLIIIAIYSEKMELVKSMIFMISCVILTIFIAPLYQNYYKSLRN